MKKIFLFLFFIGSLTGWPMSMKGQNHGTATFKNPIISGFHPDPSICRVGNDYYLVTSSFEWFPGIPVFHSKDLMHWQQIGYVLNRPSQLQMKDGLRHSNGLWAPTIRYHQGKFYVICTAQQAGGNFYVTADRPEGPYSEPVFLTDAPGIDPSLFFDEDGTCWYTGSINDTPEQDKYQNEDRIYLQQLDLKQGKLIGERHILTSGHAINAPYCEAPHIYKINHKYYLVVAEGGTWENHAVSVFTANKITGPYTPGYANPVLTHRHLGKNIDITTIGHADLVQTPQGDWWAVMLGVRPLEGYTMLGRETFLTPVSFQDGWPVFNPGVGRVLATEKATGLTPVVFKKEPVRDEFDENSLRFCWNFLRTPFEKWYQLENGKLIINVRPNSVSEDTNPSLIARRIEHFNFTAQLSMEFNPRKQEEAGMIVLQNGSHHYKVVLCKDSNRNVIKLVKREGGKEETVANIQWKTKKCFIKLVAQGLDYQFYIGDSEENMQALGSKQDASLNSSNKAGGFIGPFIGMYANSNGEKSTNKAYFDFFEYQSNE